MKILQVFGFLIFVNLSAEAPDAYDFGETIKVPRDCVVLSTRLSYVTVNKKPVVPGHLLVIPKRIAPKLKDLTAEEVADLFLLARRAQSASESHFSAPCSMIAVQDGSEAGQTVKHVHVHVVPRKDGDFERNDDVYDALQKEEGKWRTEEDMAEEAEGIRKTVERLDL